jgi:hypothetical protein
MIQLRKFAQKVQRGQQQGGDKEAGAGSAPRPSKSPVAQRISLNSDASQLLGTDMTGIDTSVGGECFLLLGELERLMPAAATSDAIRPFTQMHRVHLRLATPPICHEDLHFPSCVDQLLLHTQASSSAWLRCCWCCLYSASCCSLWASSMLSRKHAELQRDSNTL